MTHDAAVEQFERKDAFVELLRAEVCSLHFGSPQRMPLEIARLGRAQVGSIDVLSYSGVGVQWGNRRPDHIRSDRADHYLLCMPLSATLLVRQNGTETLLQPGYFAILDTAKPFWGQIRAVDESRLFSALHARIPGALLRRRLPVAANLCNRPGEITAGSSSLMRSLIGAALRDGPHLSSQQNLRLGDLLFDVICEAATPLANDTANAIAAGTLRSRAYAYERACRFIGTHLADSGLSTRQIAEHCGVSVRYLHSAFESASTTVGGFIRESRLQACRSALRDPSLRRRPIAEIASGWGFADPSHFCHAYKARFGRTPREERCARFRVPDGSDAQ